MSINYISNCVACKKEFIGDKDQKLCEDCETRGNQLGKCFDELDKKDLEIEQLRSELEAEKRLRQQFQEYWEAERGKSAKSINRECLLEFTKAYEALKSGTDCHISDSDVSNAFARAIGAVNQELRRTE